MNEVQIQIFQGRGHLVQSQLWKNLVLELRIIIQSWMSQAEDGDKWNRIKMESKPDLNSWQRWFLCKRSRLWYWYIMKFRTFIFVYNCLTIGFGYVHESRDSQWGQRTTCVSWFSLSTMWIRWIKPRSSGLEKSTLTRWVITAAPGIF